MHPNSATCCAPTQQAGPNPKIRARIPLIPRENFDALRALLRGSPLRSARSGTLPGLLRSRLAPLREGLPEEPRRPGELLVLPPHEPLLRDHRMRDREKDKVSTGRTAIDRRPLHRARHERFRRDDRRAPHPRPGRQGGRPDRVRARGRAGRPRFRIHGAGPRGLIHRMSVKNLRDFR